MLDKLDEELGELREALANGTLDEKTDELGDVLFVIANLGRMLGINPETALRNTNNKFESRFKGLEGDLKNKYKKINEASLEEMTESWNDQKRKERA